MQFTFGRSVDPITPLEVAISRVAVTTEKPKRRGDNDKGEGGKVTEFGRKAILPYALYVARGFTRPLSASRPALPKMICLFFWQSLEWMWEQDRSAARGMMTCRGLYVFSHENPLGNAHAHHLFEHVTVHRKARVDVPAVFSVIIKSPHHPRLRCQRECGLPRWSRGKSVARTLSSCLSRTGFAPWL